MHLFPNRYIFLEFGSLSITWYALFSITGFIVAYYLSVPTFKKIKYDLEKFENYFYYLLPTAYIGARIWYVIFEWHRYASNPISAFYIWEGGLAWHGGVIAGVLLAFVYCKKHKMNMLRFGDAILPNALVGQAIGRWGNFINQEAYGPIVSKESISWLPEFIQEGMFIHGNYHMPTFLYECIGNLIGFVLIRFVYAKYGRKKRGDLVYAFCMWSGLVRYVIESFRTDSLMIGPFKTAQLISLLLIVIGLLGMIGVYDKFFKNVYPFKKEKPVLLFDADGTLIDTIPLITASFRHVVEKHDPTRNMSEQDYKDIVGPPLFETIQMLFPNESEETIHQYVEDYREYNLAKHDEIVKALPNVVEMLEYCKQQGYDMGVVSNKTESLVIKGLKISGIDSYFKVILGKDQMDKVKPDPDGILKACEQLNRTHDDLIYFGDTAGDILAAKNMAAYSVAVVFDEDYRERVESAKPCTILTDWNQLKDLLEEEREWSDYSML